MLTFNLNIIPKTEGAYIVGGSIRDIYSSRIPNDYDFAVSGDPRAFASNIAKKTNGHIIKLGKPGLTLYRVSSASGLFDISPIIGATIQDDLEKRDITINAMAVELSCGKLIDPFGGMKDLQEKKVRMVAQKAFVDDPIRLLRAYRIAADFDFTLTRETSDAIKKHRELIRNSAGERVHSELIKLLKKSNSLTYLQQMIDSGLLFEIIPELTPLKGCTQNRHHTFDVFDHTLSAYGHLEAILLNRQHYLSDDNNSVHSVDENEGVLKFAMLLHDIGKPQTRTRNNGNIHFYRHEKTGTEIAEAICSRLKFSTSETRYISHIISNHLRPLFLHSSAQNQALSIKATTRFFLACGKATPDIILHALADSRGKTDTSSRETDDFNDFSKNLLASYFNQFLPVDRLEPLITGRDLIREFSIPPSPLFKTLLSQVREARLAGLISSKADALDMVRSIL